MSPQRAQRLWQRAFCYIHRITTAFIAHQCSFMACACAFCALLSIAPLLAVGVAAVGFIIGSAPAALPAVVAAIQSYIPIKPAFLIDTIHLAQQNKGIIGAVGIAGLLYAAHLVFLALQPAMNIIWGVAETRTWLRRRLIALAATVCTLALLGLDLAFSYLFEYVNARIVPLFHYHLVGVAYSLLVALLPTSVATAMIALIYRFLPDRVAPWRPVCIGAAAAGVSWQVLKFGFATALVHVHSYHRLYGTLSDPVVLVVWAYYSMVVLLIGAEIAADANAIRLGPEAAEARAHSEADLTVARGTSVRAGQ